MTTFEPTPWEERLREATERNRQEKALKTAERAQFKRRRDYGLAARHREKLRHMTRCRYLDRFGGQCTGEPIDPDGEVQLCTKHVGRVLELLKARGFVITTPAK
jgi:hypothetical protein